MNIGYGSISVYDSIRYDLFFDENTNSGYFKAFGRKYSVKLNDEYIKTITQNKKIWITLTQQYSRLISPNSEFNENEATINII
jgi:hypothetical protein